MSKRRSRSRDSCRRAACRCPTCGDRSRENCSAPDRPRRPTGISGCRPRLEPPSPTPLRSGADDAVQFVGEPAAIRDTVEPHDTIGCSPRSCGGFPLPIRTRRDCLESSPCFAGADKRQGSHGWGWMSGRLRRSRIVVRHRQRPMKNLLDVDFVNGTLVGLAVLGAHEEVTGGNTGKTWRNGCGHRRPGSGRHAVGTAPIA